MISSASTLLLATLVFNAASVFGAPIRYPNADMAVRAEITETLVPRVRFASSREVPEARDTVPPPVEKREASTEESNLPRRFPRRVYHDFYEKRADPVEPPVARAPKPDSERRFPRRVYQDLYAERADTPVARAEKSENERRYPRRALFEKRHDTAAPAVPTAVANSTDTTAVIKNFIDSTTNQTLQPGTTIKETTVLMNKVTFVSDKNPPAPVNNQCNPPPAVGSSSIPSGTPTAAATTAAATTAAATTAAATTAPATGATVPTSAAEPATSASATSASVPSSSAAPAAATPSSATSSSDAQPTIAPGAAGPSAPAPAADASATTTTAADPAASSPVANTRRSIEEVTNEPVARAPEPEAKPSGEKLQRTSGPVEAREPAPIEKRTRGPLLPRRLGFSGAALASLARRSNDH